MKLSSYVKYGDEENLVPDSMVDLFKYGEIKGEFLAYRRISLLRKPVCPQSLFSEFTDGLKGLISSEYGNDDFILIEYNSEFFNDDSKLLYSITERNVISYCICKRVGFEHYCTLYKRKPMWPSTLSKSFVLFETQSWKGVMRKDYIDSLAPECIQKEYTIEDALYVLPERISYLIVQIAKDAGYEWKDFSSVTLDKLSGGYDLKKIIATYSKRREVAQSDFL